MEEYAAAAVGAISGFIVGWCAKAILASNQIHWLQAHVNTCKAICPNMQRIPPTPPKDVWNGANHPPRV